MQEENKFFFFGQDAELEKLLVDTEMKHIGIDINDVTDLLEADNEEKYKQFLDEYLEKLTDTDRKKFMKKYNYYSENPDELPKFLNKIINDIEELFKDISQMMSSVVEDDDKDTGEEYFQKFLILRNDINNRFFLAAITYSHFKKYINNKEAIQEYKEIIKKCISYLKSFDDLIFDGNDPISLLNSKTQ